MIKITSRFLFLSLLLLPLVSCQPQGGTEEFLSYELSYTCTVGGSLKGAQVQSVRSGQAGKEVRAVAEDGYFFTGWSDGGTAATRSEPAVYSDMSYEARFALESTRGYQITYKVGESEDGKIHGHIQGQAVQHVMPGERTEPVVAISDYNYSYSLKWSDGYTGKRRSDLAPEDQTPDHSASLEYLVTFEAQPSVVRVPLLLIDTGGAEINREEYVDCTFELKGSDEDFKAKSGRIKGRGNSTWTAEKKPYKLKFDKAINLFGLKEAKTYVLLANHQDPSMVRNYGAFYFARRLGLNYTPSSQLVEVFLDSDFLGLYQLTVQIEINKNRVLDKKEDETGAADVPYLLEADGRAPQEGTADVDYFTVGGNHFAIKSPDTEGASYSSGQTQFIKSYVQEIYDAYQNRDQGRLEELIDIDSFINYYLVQEIFLNSDAGFSSIYLYKDQGGKLFAGPLWDFDRTAGNTIYDYDQMFARNSHFIYQLLFCTESLAARVKARYLEAVELMHESLEASSALFSNYREVFDRNTIRYPNVFDILPSNFGTEIYKYKTVEEHVQYYQRFMNRRLEWMSANIDSIFNS